MPPSIRNRLNRRAIQRREGREKTTTGFPVTKVIINNSLPCRRWMAGSTEQETAARVERRITDVFIFDPKADVRRDDELELDGRIYQILSVNEPSEPGVYQRSLAEEIQTGT